MKQFFFPLAGMVLFFCSLDLQAQQSDPSVGDTARVPYWIEMMQDPGANFFATQRAFNLYWQDRKVTKGSGWKVFKRWEYMMQSRVNADGSRPAPNATFNAYENYMTHSRSSGGNWVNNGPSTIPAPGPAGYEGLGRLNVVGFHPTDPNKLFAGAPSGGLWQTTDGGLTWITHTDTMPTLGVSAIVIDYSNPSKILIGTGDRDAGDAPGLGVFVSLDGGVSWAPSSTGMGDKTVGRMIQHPTNPQIILAATSGGVYRTTNGGTNWTMTKSGGFKDIHFKPNDPNIVYAAAGSDFYRSANNGVSFVKISAGLTSGQRGSIAVSAANPNYVYFVQSDGSSGFKGLYRSTDAGVTFTTRSTSPNILDWSCDGSGTGGQGWYDLAIAADPLNAETIYVGGVDVWKSTNGGTSWAINSHWYGGCNVPSVHADCHILIYSPVNGKLYAGNDGGIWSTNDGGTTWNDHTVGMTIGQIYKLGQSQTVRDKTINGFQDNGTYTFTPLGWVATGGGDGMECAIDYSNASITYHTIYYGDIYRKVNNVGEKHIAGNGVYGIDESGAWVTPFILSEADPKGMFVGYKNVWRSSNVTGSNITWTKISSSLGGNNSSDMSVLEQSPANVNILYAGRSDSKLFRTDNCMTESPVWYDMTSDLPASGTPSDLEAHPTEENTIYMTQGTGVYKSTDKGASWTNITGSLPNVTKNTIAYYRNAPEGLYVGTDAGVYYKDATTSGWISFSEGLPANGRITELEIYYDNDSVSQDVIRASTYGRGLWGSDLYHAAPDAEFSASMTTIPIGCAIRFTDESTGVPTYFQWTFEGATPSSSTMKNPTDITYATAGTYSVKLKIWNENGADSITKTGYITVSTSLLPEPDFTADNYILCTDDIVRFTDLTDNCPSSWIWSFNPGTVTFLEGTASTSQHPVVQFDQPGAYDVQLTAFNLNGPGSTTKTDYIMMGGYSLPFEESFEDGFAAKHWEVINPDGMVTWDTTQVAGTTLGTKAAWMNFFNYTAINRRDQMISPPMDFTNYGIVTMNFRHSYAQRASLKDSLIIKVSNDCGETWTRIWSAGPNGTPDAFVTAPSTMDSFFPQSADEWCGGSYGVGCYTIDLSAFAHQNDVKIMLEAYNRNGNNLFIDDISVSGIVGIPVAADRGNDIQIYPNPTTGLLHIIFNSGNPDLTYQVFNIQGQKVISGMLAANPAGKPGVIDLSSLPRGIYTMQLTASGFTQVKKVVIE
jgi:PKD repeat protein